MIGATLVRALVVTAALAAASTPCLGESSKPLPARATKELPAELLALLRQKKMPKQSPILLRIFKEEAELEVWKQDSSGRFELLKTFPICRWSGDLGPKLYEGDRQAPEGFYTVTPELMNPNSSFYLAINMGFPNSFDKANGRDGTFLMIHGDCSSMGCATSNAKGTEEWPHPNAPRGAGDDSLAARCNPLMPDATGLELIAHELRERFPGSVEDTRPLPRHRHADGRARARARRARAGCATTPAQRYTLPRQPARRRLPARPSRASASTTSC